MSSASKDLHLTVQGQDEEAPGSFVLPGFCWGFYGSLISLVTSRGSLNNEVSAHHVQ